MTILHLQIGSTAGHFNLKTYSCGYFFLCLVFPYEILDNLKRTWKDNINEADYIEKHGCRSYDRDFGKCLCF